MPRSNARHAAIVEVRRLLRENLDHTSKAERSSRAAFITCQEGVDARIKSVVHAEPSPTPWMEAQRTRYRVVNGFAVRWGRFFSGHSWHPQRVLCQLHPTQ
jgi:hypothetical protein